MTQIDYEATRPPKGLGRPTKRGQAAVEFALISIVLVVILFGILELARLVFMNAEIDNAAREGAQIAALNPNIDSATLRTQVLARMVVTDRSTVEVCRPPSAGCPPCAGCGTCAFCKVQVTVSAPWHTLVPILNWGPLATIQSSSTKLVEATNPAP